MVLTEVVFRHRHIAFTHIFAFIAAQPHIGLAGIGTQMDEFGSGMAGTGKMQFVLDGLKKQRGLLVVGG